MRLTLYKLPQPAVSVKLLCLLMVVTCGAATLIRPMRLFSECSKQYLEMYPNGTVIAKGDDDRSDPNQSLRTISRDLDIKLLITTSRMERFLCFKNFQVRGIKMSLNEAWTREECQFIENMTDAGYQTYKSAAAFPMGRFLHFNPNGQQKLPKNQKKYQKCTYFIRMPGSSDHKTTTVHPRKNHHNPSSSQEKFKNKENRRPKGKFMKKRPLRSKLRHEGHKMRQRQHPEKRPRH